MLLDQTMGNAVSGLITSFADNPDFETVSNVKNPAIAERISGALSDYDASRESGRDDLAQFRSSFDETVPARTERRDQEVANIDRFFNGDIERILGNIRANRGRATRAAAEAGIDRGLRDISSASVRRGGFGTSSYDKGLRSRFMRDELVRAALDDAEQERRDFDYLEGSRLGLSGRRSALDDAYLNSLLMPKRAEDMEQARLMQLLGAITGLDQANTFYGLEQERRPIDKAADFMGNLVDLAAAGYTGGIAGGGGVTRAPATSYFGSPGSIPSNYGFLPAWAQDQYGDMYNYARGLESGVGNIFE